MLAVGKLCSAEGFLTRDCCGPWPDWLIQLYVFSHIAIALAYFIIPISLSLALSYYQHQARIYRVRTMQPLDKRITIGFCTFIALCGTDHLLEGVVSFYWPNYYLFTAWSILTAISSWYTALILPAYLLKNMRGEK